MYASRYASKKDFMVGWNVGCHLDQATRWRDELTEVHTETWPEKGHS